MTEGIMTPGAISTALPVGAADTKETSVAAAMAASRTILTQVAKLGREGLAREREAARKQGQA